MLTNNTSEKSSIIYGYVYWEDYFSNEELNLILEYCENKKLENGLVQSKLKEEQKARVSKVNFSEPDEENRWIFNKLNRFVEIINNKFYGFDLTGYNMFQFSTYNSKENGKYDWHVDSHFAESNNSGNGLHRKLSMTLLLNDDFEGGDFEINLSSPTKINIKKGTAIFFPSFVLHRVTPVTKGIRKSLVIWVEGPRWK
jgi:PKHD-type hydroxylase